MVDWILIALVATGAITMVAGIVVLLYVFAVYAHVGGFFFDVRRNWINKWFGKRVGVQY